MSSAEIFRIAFRRLTTHPGETWLTLAGLVVGTASVIFMVTLGLTGRSFALSQIEGVGSHLIWANYDGTVTEGAARVRNDPITVMDLHLVQARTDLFRGATPLVTLHGETTILSRSADITVLGAASNYIDVRKNLRVLKGRFLEDDDVREIAKVCVVSRHLYEQLFGGDDPGDASVRTLGINFRVVGEFEEPVDTLGRGEVTPDTIFIPITVAWYFTPAHNVDTIFAEVRDLRAVPFATEEVAALLKERHHGGSRYSVEGMTTVLEVASAISTGLLLIFVLVAGVSVVVGGVGIMNIMLASVEQRTREIGLRRSVGARKRDILAQFLYEALLLGCFGAFLGVLLGVSIPIVARVFVTVVPIPVSGLSVLASFLFSAGVTILFGLAPAYRAAHLDPVEALRHE